LPFAFEVYLQSYFVVYMLGVGKGEGEVCLSFVKYLLLKAYR